MPAVYEILAGIESGSKVVVVDADDFAVVLQRRAEQNEVESFVIKKIGDRIVFLGVKQDKRNIFCRFSELIDSLQQFLFALCA